MAGTLTVYSIGTGHTSAEKNQTMRNLYNLTMNEKFLNEGITGLSQATGRGMTARMNASIDYILERAPTKLNLAGHSRGGTLCYTIANKLTEMSKEAIAGKSGAEVQRIRRARDIVEINLFTLDPVDMCADKINGNIIYMNKVNSHYSIVMENETSRIFPPNIAAAHKYRSDGTSQLKTFAGNRTVRYTVPGSHGSGTQCKTSAIGRACRGMIMRTLESWGTSFSKNPPDALEMAKDFARIHIDNPIIQAGRQRTPARRLVDDKKGHKDPKDFVVKKAEFGRLDTIAAIKGNRDPDLAQIAYFFNDYHAECFRQAFRRVFDYMIGLHVDPLTVRDEMETIKKNHRDDIFMSLVISGVWEE